MSWDEAKFQREYRSTDWNFREYPENSPASMAFHNIVWYMKRRTISEARKAARSDISVMSGGAPKGNQKNWYNRSLMYCNYPLVVLYLIKSFHKLRRTSYEVRSRLIQGYNTCKAWQAARS